MTDKQKKEMDELVLKFGNVFEYKKQNILFDLIDELQKFINFAFYMQGYNNTPRLILDEDIKEEDNVTTKKYTQPLLFISLNKRCYAPIDSESRKLFTHSDVLLASTPTLKKETYYLEENEKHPYQQAIFRSDNEFILTLKTKTIKEQFEIINILERSINVYSKKFNDNFINNFGIIKIQQKEKKDKDELKVIEIFLQFRLNEIVNYNKTYLLNAFKIFDGRDDIFEIDGSGNNFEPTNNFKDFLTKSKKVNN